MKTEKQKSGVYMLKNTVNGKCYVGQTTGDIMRRAKSHLTCNSTSSLISKAVKKYGKENFEISILMSNLTHDELDYWERLFIKEFSSLVPNGYNLQTGGHKGKVYSEESRRKISKARKGKYTGAENYMYGKTHTEEARRKISEANKGRWIGKNNSMYGRTHTEEARRKISKANTGRIPTEETRRKISEAHTGEKHHNHGKTLSVETRRKISKANKGKKLTEETKRKMSESTKGEKNPMYGKTHPDHDKVYFYYCSLPSGMTISEENKMLYSTFPHILQRTLRKWSKKWRENHYKSQQNPIQLSLFD